MGEPATADEVVQMAMDMERTGRTFYESLGSACDDRGVSRLCVRLAEQEAAHYAVFEKMHRQLAEGGQAKLLSDQQAARAHELVRAFVVPTPEEVRRVALGGKLADALDMAIQMEKDAVRFYSSVVEVLPGEMDPVTKVIQEEEAHLRDLLALAGSA